MKQTFVKSNVSGDWFYMNSATVTVRDIDQTLLNFSNLSTEIWEEAGVLEVSLSSKSSLDFESIKPYFKEKEDDEYLKKNDIHALFLVTFSAQDYDLVLPIMKHITNNLGGFFSEDNDDFSNVIR